jgi:hypothetical protein
MAVGDSFFSAVKDVLGTVMAKISGKVWPVGEPGGIKAVNGDNAVTKGKPKNCLINTAFMDATASTSGLSAYLDTAHPEPVICSSEFQTHKRFKIAMQPATVDGVAVGEGKPIDLVFDVAEGGGLQPYQVFSKINNYTGKRLQGYKIVVGQGVGDDPTTGFKSASALGIADRLHISLGKGEGAAGNNTPDGSDLFDGDGLATFSHGLFGAPDQHFTTNGFFDSRTAGFDVVQTCSVLPCVTHPNPANTTTTTFAALIDSTPSNPQPRCPATTADRLQRRSRRRCLANGCPWCGSQRAFSGTPTTIRPPTLTSWLGGMVPPGARTSTRDLRSSATPNSKPGLQIRSTPSTTLKTS